MSRSFFKMVNQSSRSRKENAASVTPTISKSRRESSSSVVRDMGRERALSVVNSVFVGQPVQGQSVRKEASSVQEGMRSSLMAADDPSEQIASTQARLNLEASLRVKKQSVRIYSHLFQH